MTKTITDKLAPLAKALQALPEDAQDAVVSEAQSRATELTKPSMTDAQRVEVPRRLTLPRVTVSHDEVRAILRRYNPAM